MCCHWPPLSSLKGSKWFFKCNAKHIMARYRMNLCDVHPHANTRLLLPFRSNCLYRKRDVHTEHIACYYMMYLKTTSGCSSHVWFNLENFLYLNCGIYDRIFLVRWFNSNNLIYFFHFIMKRKIGLILNFIAMFLEGYSFA